MGATDVVEGPRLDGPRRWSTGVRALGGSFLVIGAATGATLPFVAPLLAIRGFSAEEIGLLLAVSSLATVISVPVWGHVGDVVLGRRRALQVAALLAAMAVMWFGTPTPLVVVAAGLVVWWVLQAAFPMLVDSLALVALGGRRGEYGRFRLLQSLSFAIAALLAGIIYSFLGYGSLYLLFVVMGVGLALLLRWVDDAPRADLATIALVVPRAPPVADGRTPPDDDLPPGSNARGGSRWMDHFGSVAVCLRVAPDLPRVLVAVVLLSFATLSSGTFLPLRLHDLGAAPSVIALSATVSALCEIPVMLYGDRLVRLLGLRGFFVLGALIYAVALASWMVVSDPALIVASRALTGISYGAFTVSAVVAVGMLLPDELQASGQAMRQASMSTVAILAYLGGGLVYGLLGHAAFFGIGVGAAIAGGMTAWWWLPSRAMRRVRWNDGASA